MPSSLELPSFGPEFVVEPVTLPEFRPVVPVPSTPPVFEVAPSHGVPAEQLSAAREEARAAGYAIGWSAGLQEARAAAAATAEAARLETERSVADFRGSAARALGALERAAARVGLRASLEADELETAIIDAAYAVAEALVGDVLQDSRVRGQAAVRQALSLAPSGESVEVRVGVADYEMLEPLPSERHQITLVADPSLSPGDAVATWGSTTIDARISAGLDRVRDLLRGSP